jgi:hypothetical protein
MSRLLRVWHILSEGSIRKCSVGSVAICFYVRRKLLYGHAICTVAVLSTTDTDRLTVAGYTAITRSEVSTEAEHGVSAAGLISSSWSVFGQYSRQWTIQLATVPSGKEQLRKLHSPFLQIDKCYPKKVVPYSVQCLYIYNIYIIKFYV